MRCNSIRGMPTAMAGMARAYEMSGRMAMQRHRSGGQRIFSRMTGTDTTTLRCFYDRQGKIPAVNCGISKQALQLAPDNAQVLFNLGGTYIDSGGCEVISLEAEAS